MSETKIAVPEELKELAQAYSLAGGRLYIVGGAVRNSLLGLSYSDIDICGPLLQDSVEEICNRLGLYCIRMSTQLGTLKIRINQQDYEYTPFRTEEYAQGGEHRPQKVCFGASLQQDAERRDFTVNAIYADAITGILEDPLGGLDDIKSRLLRCCAEDTLEWDALRIMRLVRFSGELGFGVEKNTLALAKKNVDKIHDIAIERIWAEFIKILLCDVRYSNQSEDSYAGGYAESEKVYLCLKQMEDIGLIERLYPQLMEGRGISQRPDYHRYTVLEHAYHSCASAVPELTIRLAGLFHDIGKPVCMKMTGNYHKHMLYGEEIVEKILRRVPLTEQERTAVVFLVRNHMYDIQNTAKVKTIRMKFAKSGKQYSRNLILIREADIRGSGTRPDYKAEKWRKLYEKMLCDGTPFSLRELKICGKDVMKETGVSEGKEIGEILNELWDACILHPSNNDRDKLIRMLKTKER